LKGRSFCPYCHHQLSWQDLIPVFSFLILRGACRYCHKKISWQYPLVEIPTGILFILAFNVQPLFFNLYAFNLYNFISFFYLIIISCFLIIIFVYDLKHFIIPDKVIFPAIAVAFIYNLSNIHSLIYNAFPAALGVTLFFLIIFLISRGKWLGFGDVKLVFFLGLILGFPSILVAFFLSFLIGAIIGTGLIVLGKKTLKSEVPFAPFLVVGTFVALFWGKLLLNWYISFIF